MNFKDVVITGEDFVVFDGMMRVYLNDLLNNTNEIGAGIINELEPVLSLYKKILSLKEDYENENEF